MDDQHGSSVSTVAALCDQRGSAVNSVGSVAIVNCQDDVAAESLVAIAACQDDVAVESIVIVDEGATPSSSTDVTGVGIWGLGNHKYVLRLGSV
jgi:hypothetical protein